MKFPELLVAHLIGIAWSRALGPRDNRWNTRDEMIGRTFIAAGQIKYLLAAFCEAAFLSDTTKLAGDFSILFGVRERCGGFLLIHHLPLNQGFRASRLIRRTRRSSRMLW